MASRSQLWRISDRSTFAALRRDGRRARSGGISVTWLAPVPGADPTPPRAAFAVGRGAGGAVVRNRVRRRLRAALRELQRHDQLPGGAYLVGAGREAATSSWRDLCGSVTSAVRSATAVPA